MFFEDWQGIVRILVLGTLAYAGLVVLLRISGKRTLSKMNAFDLIVTVALGSTLATVIVSKQVPLAEGLTALALLIVLQYVVAWLSVRSERFQGLVKATPQVLLLRGEPIHANLRRERVSLEEVYAALRQQGSGHDQVLAVILETDGTLSVIPHGPDQDGAALNDLIS